MCGAAPRHSRCLRGRSDWSWPGASHESRLELHAVRFSRHRLMRGSTLPPRRPPRLKTTPGFGMAIGPRWQHAAVTTVTAFAGLSVVGTLWGILAPLAPVLGLFFGGW